MGVSLQFGFARMGATTDFVLNKTHRKPEHKEIMSTLYVSRKTSRTEDAAHVVRDQPSKRDVGQLLDGKCYEDFGAGADVVAVQGTQPRPDETAVVVSFSWCKSLDAIYFRTSEMQRKLKKLENEMKEHYTNATNNTPKFDIGYRCAVFADMQWWRAEVICVDSSPGGSCEVSLVDTGYQLTVEGKNIYPLDPIFDEYPRLIMNCSLVGVYPPGAAGWDNSVSIL